MIQNLRQVIFQPITYANKARIFISYSHQGNGPKWKASLVRHLGVFEQHHLLDVWQDGKIRVSSYWHDDIQQAMSNARLAVVLLTPAALESEYILNTEFPFLRERQQRDKLPVFPVVCEKCNWKAHDWLRATQAPNESNPLSQLSEAAQECVFRKLASAVAEELSRAAFAEQPSLASRRHPITFISQSFRSRAAAASRKSSLVVNRNSLSSTSPSPSRTPPSSRSSRGAVWARPCSSNTGFGVSSARAGSVRDASMDGASTARELGKTGRPLKIPFSPTPSNGLACIASRRSRRGTKAACSLRPSPANAPCSSSMASSRFNTRPGPMGGQLRAPGVQSLLKQLARKANNAEHGGLCLVTTREPLTDLIDFQRRPDAAWGSVLRVDLGNLSEEAGAALLHHAGAKRAGAADIKADDAELVAASREVDGHALTLNLLGRFLARAHGGDIRRRDLVKFEQGDRKEQGGTTFKMLATFENWFARSGEFGARQLAILRILGLFDRPADAGCIGELRKLPAIPGLTVPLFVTTIHLNFNLVVERCIPEEDWNTALSFLADFGLVTSQIAGESEEWLIDCHPLIREYFAEKLSRDEKQVWRAANCRLYRFLAESAPEKPPTSLNDLIPLYQAMGHGCAAGKYREAFSEIFWKRIVRGEPHYSEHTFFAFAEQLAAIARFFDHC